MQNFKIERDGETATVVVGGDICAASAPELRPAMRDLVKSGVRRMVFDLTETSMVDSTGIGLLLAAFNSMRNSGGEFSVVHASDEILDLLKTMRITQHFSVSGR
jgi:anti-sigma B factor antagonist